MVSAISGASVFADSTQRQLVSDAAPPPVALSKLLTLILSAGRRGKTVGVSKKRG